MVLTVQGPNMLPVHKDLEDVVTPSPSKDIFHCGDVFASSSHHLQHLCSVFDVIPGVKGPAGAADAGLVQRVTVRLAAAIVDWEVLHV